MKFSKFAISEIAEFKSNFNEYFFLVRYTYVYEQGITVKNGIVGFYEHAQWVYVWHGWNFINMPSEFRSDQRRIITMGQTEVKTYRTTLIPLELDTD